MKHKLLFAAAILAMSLGVNGQDSNTIYQNITVNNSASGQLTFGPVRNIGQASHQAYISLTTIPTHSPCNLGNTTTSIRLFGSNINSFANSVAIPQIVNTYNAGTLLTQGTALYPFVFVDIHFTDPSGNCQFSAFYAGSTQSLSVVNNNVSQALLSDGSSGPGTLNLLPSQAVGMTYLVYGLELSTSGASATVQIVCAGGYSMTWTLAVGQPFAEHSSSPPLLVCNNGGKVDAVITGAGATVNAAITASSLPAGVFLF